MGDPRSGGGGWASEVPAEEIRLLEGLRTGDEKSYETLVRTYGGRLLATARRFLGDGEDAHDAVQDAFVSAFRSIESFDGDSPISAWLHRIVVNASLMKLRSKKRKPETSIEHLLPEFLEDGHHVRPAAAWNTSATDAERKETRELVRRYIDQLPDAYRAVLLLRDIEEFDTAETARLLGVTENAAKIRLHRARMALRTLLDPHFREATG